MHSYVKRATDVKHKIDHLHELIQKVLLDDVQYGFLLYEYRDLFIDMAVRNNRSELAIANRHQER